MHQGIENCNANLKLHQGEDQDPKFRVKAGFEKGVSNRIKYISLDGRKISDHAVSVLLSRNSKGVAWIVQEFPKKEGKVYYRSVDSRYRAVLTNQTELFIFTEKLFQKTTREIDSENQKSKDITSSLVPSGCVTQSLLKTYPDNQPIQQITDKAVADARKTLNPKGIAIVVAEPDTGKILAISDWPYWPPKALPDPRTGKPAPNLWTSCSLFEPGSTFKPVVAVAALEKGVITPDTKINCENGPFRYQGKLIKDHFPLGDATPEEILAKSSNIGVSKIALMLKDDDYYQCVKKFGFGERTGISLSYECRGLVNPPSKWLALTKVRMSMGQSVAVTPIQLTMAYCALANGGNLMRPVIGDEKPKVVRRVCSKSTANRVKNALQKTVSPDGTAPLARVEGVTVAGEPGTAQAISPKGGYLPDQYWTMFAGFFPVDHPQYVVVVVVEKADLPSDKNFGGLVAAPIFSEVATKISVLKTGGRNL
jgi:membrane carboxypeptidase/penicillin-binding protein PbpC